MTAGHGVPQLDICGALRRSSRRRCGRLGGSRPERSDCLRGGFAAADGAFHVGRPLKDVLTICDDLHERSIGVRILTGKLSGIYSPTGEGKFFFTMMAAFAELERDINHERTMAGLAAARAQGNVGGRPTVMDADKLAAAKARRARGESPTQIAKALGVSRASVYRHLAAVSTPAAS
jgi:DNA invertase Pin-like site-specific DNA recombinase